MTKSLKRALAATLAVGMMFSTAGCDEFLTVDNPEVVDASTVDPLADAAVFSLSARQDFAAAYGWHIMYSGWFTGETLVSETFPTRNEFGRRDVSFRNTSLTPDLFRPLSVATSSNTSVLRRAQGAAGSEKSLDVARSALFAGYSFLIMAEMYCQGVVQGGPPLTTAQLLDSAQARFTQSSTVAAAVTGADTIEGKSTRNAALVGLARAQLQAGNRPAAATTAAQVPATFVYNLLYVDDIGQRTRLGNRLREFTVDRQSIVVAPDYRVNDPRVPFLPPSQQLGLTGQDGTTPFFTQQKYPAFNSPIRLASGIEARYIVAEAQGTAAMLALIAERRTANQQGAYTGGTDEASVRVEFFEQRAREFYLEGKKLGDLRRAPDAVRKVPVPGAAYFKSGFAPIGNQTCFPIPATETENNPNFPKS